MTKQPSSGYRMDRTISVMNIIAVLTVGLSGFGAYDALTDRIARLESTVEFQLRVDATQDESLLRFRAEMKERTQQINDKLDRLIERMGGG